MQLNSWRVIPFAGRLYDIAVTAGRCVRFERPGQSAA
jgi:hypothetical protein